MPDSGLNLGKMARVICAMLPRALLLFVQRDIPPPNQQGALRPKGGLGSPRHLCTGMGCTVLMWWESAGGGPS